MSLSASWVMAYSQLVIRLELLPSFSTSVRLSARVKLGGSVIGGVGILYAGRHPPKGASAMVIINLCMSFLIGPPFTSSMLPESRAFFTTPARTSGGGRKFPWPYVESKGGSALRAPRGSRITHYPLPVTKL